MKTKKAAAHDEYPRDDTADSDGPRRYTLHTAAAEDRGHAAYGRRSPWGDWPLANSRAIPRRASAGSKTIPAGQGTTAPSLRALANHAQPVRTEPQFIPQAMRPENPFRPTRAAAPAKNSRHKVAIPREFAEWAERQGFSPAAAARFVLAWFCEREKVDKPVKVQYTCANTVWPTNAPRTKKM